MVRIDMWKTNEMFLKPAACIMTKIPVGLPSASLFHVPFSLLFQAVLILSLVQRRGHPGQRSVFPGRLFRGGGGGVGGGAVGADRQEHLTLSPFDGGSAAAPTSLVQVGSGQEEVDQAAQEDRPWAQNGQERRRR